LADDVFDTAVAKLFDEEKDAIELIRVKEILQNLEKQLPISAKMLPTC
jgi:uncharacterized protein Yka (UPF0111/DUF47 family)